MYTLPVLEFVESEPQAYLPPIFNAIQNGGRHIYIYPATTAATSLAAALDGRLSGDVSVTVLSALPTELLSDTASPDAGAAFVLAPEKDSQLSDLLLKFLDWRGGWLIAPKTDRFFANNSLFLISIPKAGTHLLYELARQMGYRDGVELRGLSEPAHWYCVEYSNSHTAAADFFIDSVRRNPFGNRAHPFPRTPTLFIYRNPLDILVSEANYYHNEGKTAFSGYLSQLSFEQRVERLIADPWLLGSIRDRVGKFLAWLDFPNVIPVSYEELVGTRGGGDDKIRVRLIWALQLKLHVPGQPAHIADALFDQDSPTFHKGAIGGYREALSDRAFVEFFKLDQDFMSRLGYVGCDRKEAPFPPGRAEEFRRRPLRLSAVDHSDTPVAVGVCLGCNLVSYRRRFYAIPQHLGELNLTTVELVRLDSFVSAPDLDELQALLSWGPEAYSAAKKRACQVGADSIEDTAQERL